MVRQETTHRNLPGWEKMMIGKKKKLSSSFAKQGMGMGTSNFTFPISINDDIVCGAIDAVYCLRHTHTLSTCCVPLLP